MDKSLRWAYAQFLEFPAEKPPSNRFGRYWTEGTKSRRGASGRPLWFRTAPPPRVGAASPRRWAAEPPPGLRSSKRVMAVVAELTAAVGGNPSRALCKAIERAAMRPYGPRPYEIRRLVLIRQSQVITDQLKLSNDRFNLQRLRDLKVHILEQRRRCSGFYWAELASIELYRRHDQLRWFVDARFEADNDVPFIDSAIAGSAGYGFQEVDNTVERRRRKYGRPLRERRKAGRKPIGLIAQTTAERVRKHRRNKVLKRSPPTSVATAGAAQLCAPELTAPAALSTHAQGGDTT